MFNTFIKIVFLLNLVFISLSTVAEDENFDFLDLTLEQLRNVTINVASLTPETISQSPVPVSLITAEMIKQSGAFTLKELLLTYVPGFNDVEDQNEINIAARGIYTSSQQKILIMINGHRVNSRSYSMAAPDHSISLDKVKQIEVLRGPASSLYGNVSLSATINIILKDANENQELKVKALLGNYGQQGVSLTYGVTKAKLSGFIWANTFKNEGETINLAADQVYSATPNLNNQAIIGGIRDKSSYDIGLTFTYDKFKIFANSHRSHYIEPYSGGGLTGEPYNYQEIGKINGYSPGLGYTMNHLNISYESTIKDWQNITRLYWDNYSSDSTVVITPNIPVYGGPHWKDQTFGLLSTFERHFKSSSILTGFQLETYSVYGANFPLFIGGDFTETNNILPSGSESNISAFFQYQSAITQNWHTNLGGRSDFKDRKFTDNIQQFSPRLALIYSQEDQDIKLSYAKSFVDATYWNRFSTLPAFIGASSLKPETLETIQLTPSLYLPNQQIQLTTNIFYDMAKNVIFRDNSATSNNYSNSGELASWGIEQELTYINGNVQLRFSGAYRRAIDSELIKSKNGAIANIPEKSFSIVFDKKFSDKLGVNINVRYVGKQFSPTVIQQDGVKIEDPWPDQGVNFDDPNRFISDATLVNSNIRYAVSDKITIGFKITNLFDKQHLQGGSTLHPYQKPGRWYSAQIEMSL
jgi:iron complex outermembrane receptor protein